LEIQTSWRLPDAPRFQRTEVELSAETFQGAVAELGSQGFNLKEAAVYNPSLSKLRLWATLALNRGLPVNYITRVDPVTSWAGPHFMTATGLQGMNLTPAPGWLLACDAGLYPDTSLDVRQLPEVDDYAFRVSVRMLPETFRLGLQRLCPEDRLQLAGRVARERDGVVAWLTDRGLPNRRAHASACHRGLLAATIDRANLVAAGIQVLHRMPSFDPAFHYGIYLPGSADVNSVPGASALVIIGLLDNGTSWRDIVAGLRAGETEVGQAGSELLRSLRSTVAFRDLDPHRGLYHIRSSLTCLIGGNARVGVLPWLWGDRLFNLKI